MQNNEIHNIISWQRVLNCILLSTLLLAPLTTWTANIYWTGAGGDGLWSNTGNWDLSRIPESGDIVMLGYATDGASNLIADLPQVINLDLVGTSIAQINLEPTGNRSVTLDGNTLTLTDATAVIMNSSATTNAFLNTSITVSATYALIRNDCLAALLTVAGGSGSRAFHGDGTIRVTSTISNPTRFLGQLVIADMLGWFVNQSVQFYNDTTIHWARGSGFVRTWEGSAYFAVIESDEDITISSTYGMTGNDTDRITIIANPDGSLGNLIIRPREMRLNSLEFATCSGSIIEFERIDNRAIEWADNSGISGAGSLWKSGSALLEVKRAMAYTGRTMLQNGILRLESHTSGEDIYYGQLPTGTVVEIASGATLDLNSINQTIGGVRGFTGRFQDQSETFGTLALSGATLTIHATQPSIFAGSFSGNGALIKTGTEKFTIATGYTNATERLLRVANGILEFDGALELTTNGFELTGGYVAAASFDSPGARWVVTLTNTYENDILVDIQGAADITDAVLELDIAGEYTPLIGATYTILQASALNGVVASEKIFQYTPGRAFEIDGIWFRLMLADDNQHIILKVIEPIPKGVLFIVK